MKFLKKIIKKYLFHFSYFYTHLRNRLFVALGLSLVVGVLDGFGLAMFLPLLQMVDGQSHADAEGLGNLGFLVEGLENLGIELTISSVLIIILTFFSLKGAAKFLEVYYKVLVQQYFIRRLRFNTLDKLSNFSYKAFVLADSGRIQNTLSGEVGRVATAYETYFTSVQAGIMVLVYIGLAFLTNPQFAILVSVGGALTNLIFKRIYSRTKETSRKISRVGHLYQGQLIQIVAFFKYLKATGLISDYTQRLKRTVTKIEENNKIIGFNNALLVAVREPLVVLVVVVVIIIQVTYFSRELGAIILSLLFFYRSLTFLMLLQNQWNLFLNVSGSLENMTDFVAELSLDQDKRGGEKVDGLTRSIEFKNLSLKYGSTTVLNDINLLINKNETVAFVGESGSGKTTLVNVLAGLMPVEHGSMLIDGKLSSKTDMALFQKKIGYITQEPVIFSDTVYNNITCWAEDNPENKIRFWEALRKAAIDDFVRGLPEKEEAVLGNNGVAVSGGQKQRLSIAREFYKDIDILIMDEATSALDAETEKEIQKNIDALQGKYTIVIVAHRLATVKNADKIVLLEKGEISCVGDFNTLAKKSASFNRMVSLQEL